jgi:hypothetical protein
MIVRALHCNSCRYSPGTFTIEGVLHVLDAGGRFVRCLHPLEHRTIREVLGKDAEDEPVRQRTVRLHRWLCLDCLAAGEHPRGSGAVRCAGCGSERGAFLADMDASPCPACGGGRMVLSDTGLVV